MDMCYINANDTGHTASSLDPAQNCNHIGANLSVFNPPRTQPTRVCMSTVCGT